jgi:acyl dehydratase
MHNTCASQPLSGPLWPLLLRAGLTLLKPQRAFGSEPREFYHQLPAPGLAELGAYQQFFGFAPDMVPICFYYPLLQKAQLTSMLQCKGLKVAGLIHLYNNLQAQQNQTPAQLCAGGPLQIQTRLSTVKHAKGLLLRAEQQLWQQQQLVLSSCSDYLLHKAPRAVTKAGAATAQIQPGQPLGEINTAPDAPKAYARLSGDFNPIHLWRWSALLFGQPRPILHGMASAALLCQALPKPVQQLQLQFKTPVLPGIALQLTQQSTEQSSAEYALWQQGRLCLLASLQIWPDGAEAPDAG